MVYLQLFVNFIFLPHNYCYIHSSESRCYWVVALCFIYTLKIIQLPVCVVFHKHGTVLQKWLGKNKFARYHLIYFQLLGFLEFGLKEQ